MSVPTIEMRTINDIVRILNAHDELVAALRLAERELAAVAHGSTGGIPNSVIALIPEAREAIRAALVKATN